MAKRVKLEDGGGAYLAAPPAFETFKSGCTLLDLINGGGWAVGGTVNVVGDKSTGKCVRNAYIRSSSLGLVKIDDLGFPTGATSRRLPDLALRGHEEVQASSSWREVVSETFRVQANGGFELEGTGAHRVLVWTSSGTFVMRRLDHLAVDDQVVIAPLSNLTELPVELPPHPVVHRNSRHLNLPKTLTPLIAELLGLFVADGTSGRTNLEISNERPWVETSLRRIAGELGLSLSGKPGQWFLCSAALHSWVSLLFGKGLRPGVFTARAKFVPPVVLRAPANVQFAFLRALLDCDGYQDSNGVIIYSTASERLAREVQMLLLGLGIVSSRVASPGPAGYEDHQYHDVSILARYVDLFLDQAGSSKYRPVESASWSSRIPYAGDLVKAWIRKRRTELGWRRNGKVSDGRRFPHYGTTMVTSSLTRTRLVEFVRKFEGWGDLTVFKRLLRLPYEFFAVQAVDRLFHPAGVDVYDFCVPDGHRYWTSGFISHNTQLATEAMANYHAAFPDRPIRYNDAESAYDKPYASILGCPASVEPWAGCSTVESFAADFKVWSDGIKDDAGGLYILDSLDALTDDAEMAREVGEASYGMAKAKLMSEFLRKSVVPTARKKITLFIVSQVRSAVGVTQGRPTTRAGGRALDFYALQIVYLTHTGRIEVQYKNVKRCIGISVKAKNEKNKVGTPFQQADYPLLFNFGIEDVESMIDWLVETKRAVLGFDSEAEAKRTLKSLREMPTEEWGALRKRLRAVVRAEWKDIERAVAPIKRKYV